MLRSALVRPGREASAGFTLIELIVVATLIAVLAGMGVVQYRHAVVRTKEAVLKEDLFRMRDAIDQYYADKAKYPDSLETLVTEGYLRQVPVDPTTNSADTWQTVLADPDVEDPTAEVGIFDVKSGSEGTSVDGSAYADW